MWAWIGQHAPTSASRGALAAARGLARARRYTGPVSCTPAGKEPLEFAALFSNWKWCDARRDVRLRAARSATTRLDAVSLASNAWLAAEVSGATVVVDGAVYFFRGCHMFTVFATSVGKELFNFAALCP